MDYNEIVRNMTNTILDKVKKAIDEKVKSDQTFTATITEKINDTEGRADYNGTSRKFTSTLPFKEGDTVRLCAPCNNWDDLFIVENKTKGRRFIDITEVIS